MPPPPPTTPDPASPTPPPSRGQRLRAILLDPDPPWHRSTVLWFFLFLIAWTVSLATAPHRDYRFTFAVALIKQPDGNLVPWDDPPITRGTVIWHVPIHTTVNIRQTHERYHVQVDPGSRTTFGFTRNVPVAEEELQAALPAIAATFQKQAPHSQLLPPEHLDRIPAAILTPGTPTTVWNPAGVVVCAARQLCLLLLLALVPLAVARRIRYLRIRRAVTRAASLRCPACGYDLSGTYPARTTCPECNAHFPTELDRQAHLIAQTLTAQGTPPTQLRA